MTDADLGAAIRRAREWAGLSQTALAERMAETGVAATPFLVSRVEMGQRPARATELVAFARALGMPPEVLVRQATADALSVALDDVDQARERAREALTRLALVAGQALSVARDAHEEAEQLRVSTPREMIDRLAQPWDIGEVVVPLGTVEGVSELLSAVARSIQAAPDEQ